MLIKGFKKLIGDISDQELIELGYFDPNFLIRFCYMLTLEIQVDKEKESYERT
tara:strand:+ start:72 stop:230 length:159 start_codon:yes stop_codon:yes gene_type:complete